jgi:RecA/RadA recombinase
VRIDVRKKEKLGPQDGATGIRVNAKIVKNKVAPPFRWV